MLYPRTNAILLKEQKHTASLYRFRAYHDCQNEFFIYFMNGVMHIVNMYLKCQIMSKAPEANCLDRDISAKT